MKAKHSKAPAERVVKDIRCATRKQYSAEDKIRIVLEGLRGEYIKTESKAHNGNKAESDTIAAGAILFF